MKKHQKKKQGIFTRVFKTILGIWFFVSTNHSGSMETLGIAGTQQPPLQITAELLDKCRTQGPSFDSEDYLGIIGHFPQGDGELEQAQREFRFGLMSELGVKHTREDIMWSMVETKKGIFDLNKYGKWIGEAEKADVKILPILAYGNSLYNKNPKDDIYRPPTPLSAFEPFVDHMVNLFSPHENIYEIWNEPNIGVRFWKTGFWGQPKEYGDLLKIASKRIRQKDPSAKIVLGGIATASLRVSPGDYFLSELYKHHPDLSEYYDYLSWHPYRYPHTSPDTSSPIQMSFSEELTSVSNFFINRGLSPKKIWLTEMGWQTAPKHIVPGVSPDVQANFLVESAIIALELGVGRFYWYKLVEGDDPYNKGEDAFGLYGNDKNILLNAPQPKPGFFAYKTLVKMLQPYRYVLALNPSVSLQNNQRAYLLCSRASSQFTIVTWLSSGQSPSKVAVKLSSDGPYMKTDLYGQVTQDANDDGQSSLSFYPQPIYFTGKITSKDQQP